MEAVNDVVEYDETSPKYWSQVHNAIAASYKELEIFRELNTFLVKEYAGPKYTREAGRTKYLPKLNQAIDAYMMLLAANRPQAQIMADHPSLRAFAKHYEVAVNNMLKEISMETTVRECVLNALLGGLGIIRTHYADSGQVVLAGDVAMDPGTPFASNVLLDDWVHDVSSKRYTGVRFAGHMYRITWAKFKKGVEMGLYDADAAKEVRPTNNFGPGDESAERIDRIALGEQVDSDNYEPMVDLADVWFPEQKVIRTFAVESRSYFRCKGMPLATDDERKDRGPFHLLGFSDVPGNIMPTSVASHLEALESLINNLARKSSRQARRQKENLVYTAAGAKTAEALQKSDDGEGVQANSLQEVALFKQGGVNQGTAMALEQALAHFDTQAGNLTAMLGLGAQAETVGQEQLIHSAGSRKGAQMQYRVLEFATGVIESLGEMLWEDQFKTIAGVIHVQGLSGLPNGEFVQSDWLPGDREGNFAQYNFAVNVYSMMYRPPAQQAQTVTELLTTVFIPMMDAILAQGGTFDIQALTEMYAEMLSIPSLRSVITFGGTPPNMVPPQVSTGGKPPVTTRNYNRTSRPGGQQDPQSKLAQMNFGNQPDQSGMVMMSGMGG